MGPGNGGIQQNAAVRETHVGTQMDRNACAIKMLHDSIGKLEVRLEAVLRNQTPSPAEGKNPEKEYLVVHAAHLRDTADVTEQAVSRLESILNRLEI